MDRHSVCRHNNYIIIIITTFTLRSVAGHKAILVTRYIAVVWRHQSQHVSRRRDPLQNALHCLNHPKHFLPCNSRNCLQGGLYFNYALSLHSAYLRNVPLSILPARPPSVWTVQTVGLPFFQWDWSNWGQLVVKFLKAIGMLLYYTHSFRTLRQTIFWKTNFCGKFLKLWHNTV